ncbi:MULTISPECIES: flagellar basal body-associated FliL family protein [Falsihalocynthiibacter]|uniref:flagellar basal body-associated FliL family protein n=1 Tax=Falsihalocynthiibacter TaxID=2854182 RepID=UPI0030029268
MADKEQPTGENEQKKSSKKPMVIGLVLLLLGGGGGFAAVKTGMIFGQPSDDPEIEHVEIDALPNVEFVPLDPLLISLGGPGRSKHLRFTAQIEVEPKSVADVTRLVPRIVDVLNSYLRAVDITELESPSSLIKLRAQMLRRIQMVTGEGHVRDLLIMEFVLN